MSLTMDDLVRAAHHGNKFVREELSVRELLEMSYSAGGMYPTLVGYMLGATAMLIFARCTSWMFRTVPAALSLALFLYTFYSLERQPLEWILVLAAAIGACCTYVQLTSLDLVRAHFALKKVSNHKKRD